MAVSPSRQSQRDCAEFLDRAYRAAAAAYTQTSDSWPQAIQAALACLLDFMAADPDMTHMCLVEAFESGDVALERRDRTLERFAGFLEPGYDENPEPPPAVVAEAVSGGVLELIRAHAVERRIESLPDALPEATLIVLSPFLGSKEAERLASTPVRVRMRT